MSIFDFIRNHNSQKNNYDFSEDNYDLLVKFYEEYVKSCTLQPILFGQMAYPNGEMDVYNNDVRNKKSYISQYSRLMDAIRLGNIKDATGKEININLLQEYYLRFLLATWIMSQINSYDTLGMQIREAMDNGYTHLAYVVNMKVLSRGRWHADGEVYLHRTDSDAVKCCFNNVLLINEEKFYSKNPIQIYDTFDCTPNSLLTSFYQIVYMLMVEVPPIVDLKDRRSRGRFYADFWLKKMIAAIVVCSDEWQEVIHDEDNIEKIENIRYYLWNEDPFNKQIQFKFDIKLSRPNKWISLDYEYTISKAEVFGLRNINRLCQFVLWNHNLQN